MVDRFASRLVSEVQAWVRDGLITAQQASRILARYPASAAWFTRPIALFSLVGGALVAAGIALVVAHNWAEIHRWAKLGGVIVLMLGAHAGGLALRDQGRRNLGDGLVLLGGALLLVGIALVGQIYQLSGRLTDTVLLWWALLLPGGYALPSAGLLALAYTGAGVWFLLTLADETTLLGQAVHEAELLTAVAVSAFGFVLFGLGIVHGERVYRRIGRFLELLGLTGIMVGLFMLSGGWHSLLLDAQRVGTVAAARPVFGLLFLAFLAFAAAVVWLPPAASGVRVGFVFLLLVVVLLLNAFATTAVTPATAPLRLLLHYTTWVVLFAFALGLILAGARWGRTTWINVGLLSMLVQAVWRYLDLLGSMLGTGALFLSTGLFVLLLGWGLERLRRQMTRRARTVGD